MNKAYKVVFHPAASVDVFEKEVQTLVQAVDALNIIADYTLMLHEKKFMVDHTNTGFIMMMKDGYSDWIIWESPCGEYEDPEKYLEHIFEA